MSSSERVRSLLGKRSVALRPPTSCLCIVMVCTDMSEADTVSRQLSELNTGYLVTYRKMADLLASTPVGTVALVILASDEAPATLGRTLRWLRDRWPRCPVAVLGDHGGDPHEMAAREGGAFYLTRPVPPEHWGALLSHVLHGQPQQEQREPHRDL